MQRLAIISDIHGNLVALRAVLDDIASCGVTDVYCLGDLVGYGPDPVGVVSAIRAEGIPTLRGNYDDGVGLRKGECGCYYATEQARADGEASYRFTDAALDAASAAWLATRPDSIRLEIGGLRVLLSHGSPRKINEYLHEDRSDEQLARIAENAGADVVFVGHTHVPYDRVVPRAGMPVRYVNVGSVGKPKDGDPRSCWCEAVFDVTDPSPVPAVDDEPATDGASPGVRIEFHRVSYDVASVQEAMRRAGLPDTLVAALQTA